MAFRTGLSAAEAFANLKQQATVTKGYLVTQRTAMVQATCDAAIPLAAIQHLGAVNARMTSWAATPGLSVYAQNQYNDPTYDVVAEFNAMKSAMSSAQTNLTSMFPKDANGFILYQTIQTDGSLLNRTFTAAQLASAVTQIDAVIASIA